MRERALRGYTVFYRPYELYDGYQSRMLKWLGYFALCNVIIAGGRWVIPVVMARTTGPGPGGAPKRNSALSPSRLAVATGVGRSAAASWTAGKRLASSEGHFPTHDHLR